MHYRFKDLLFGVKAVDQNNYTIRGVFSSGVQDRHGEVVNQNGWNLTEYMTNPVVLFQHDMSLPPVGKVIELGLNQQNELEGVIQFAVKENPQAEVVYNLYAGGFMRAFSAGFRNDEYSIDNENDVVRLIKNTLYEISCVSVPANQLALAKQKGINTAEIEAYESKRSKIKIEEPKAEEPVAPEKKEEDAKIEPEKKEAEENKENPDASKNLTTLREANKMLNELISSAERTLTDNQVGPHERSLPLQKGGVRFSKNLLNKVIRKLHESKHIL